jgi:uncharacterized membrane protein
MKITYSKYPMDIIICIIWSIILIPLVLLDIEDASRIIIGLPFILFIPGYILIFALFPVKKTIDTIERLALSLGLSIAIVPLIGLGLNYTPFGIRLQPILFSIFLFIILLGIIGTYRWYKTQPDERFKIKIDISLPESKNKLDKILTIILIIVIIVAFTLLIYVIVTPKIGERFTEFYLLGPSGNASGYPSNLTKEENASVIIGIANHEYKTINYTIEIWLVNQTTTQENQSIYHNMWYMEKINITLNHTYIDIEKPWIAQWEYNYTFNINRTGLFKLAFLLYDEPTEKYFYDMDYKYLANQKIDTINTTAYRSLHLWLNIL